MIFIFLFSSVYQCDTKLIYLKRQKQPEGTVQVSKIKELLWVRLQTRPHIIKAPLLQIGQNWLWKKR